MVTKSIKKYKILVQTSFDKKKNIGRKKIWVKQDLS